MGSELGLCCLSCVHARTDRAGLVHLWRGVCSIGLPPFRLGLPVRVNLG
jgi:hypothetical protein